MLRQLLSSIKFTGSNRTVLKLGASKSLGKNSRRLLGKRCPRHKVVSEDALTYQNAEIFRMKLEKFSCQLTSSDLSDLRFKS